MTIAARRRMTVSDSIRSLIGRHQHSGHGSHAGGRRLVYSLLLTHRGFATRTLRPAKPCPVGVHLKRTRAFRKERIVGCGKLGFQAAGASGAASAPGTGPSKRPPDLARWGPRAPRERAGHPAPAAARLGQTWDPRARPAAGPSSCGRGARHGTPLDASTLFSKPKPCGYWLGVESTSTWSAQSCRGAEN